MYQMELQEIIIAKTINDIDLGVMKDGTAYTTERGLARLCGVDRTTVRKHRENWEEGRRGGVFAQRIGASGFNNPVLAFPIKTGAAGVAGDALAYPEQVVMAFLDYYAFEQNRPEARNNFRILATAGFRLFVYTAVGYDPQSKVPDPWRAFHDRLAIHALPPGYFSVFKEMSDFVLLAIQNDLRVDQQNIPDISVGIRWAKYWKDNNMAAQYGDSRKCDHNYPDYFPQSKSNPQDINIYPIAALGEFRAWLQNVYIPNHFPEYLESKVKKHVLPASTAELLLAAVETPKKLKA